MAQVIVGPTTAGSGPRESALLAYNARGAGPLLQNVSTLPRPMSVPVTIAVIVALGVAVWLSQRTVRRRVLKRMQSRPARTPGEFGCAFFPPESAPIATKVREILARHLTVDLSRLSPEDTFVDLEMAELDSMATVGFVLDLEREFGIKIPDPEAERMKTFRDVVQYVSGAPRQSVG